MTRLAKLIDPGVVVRHVVYIVNKAFRCEQAIPYISIVLLCRWRHCQMILQLLREAHKLVVTLF